jgi:hypothetical protein
MVPLESISGIPRGSGNILRTVAVVPLKKLCCNMWLGKQRSNKQHNRKEAPQLSTAICGGQSRTATVFLRGPRLSLAKIVPQLLRTTGVRFPPDSGVSFFANESKATLGSDNLVPNGYPEGAFLWRQCGRSVK